MYCVLQNIILVSAFFFNAFCRKLQELLAIGNFHSICTTLTKIPKRFTRLFKLLIVNCLNRLPLTIYPHFCKNSEQTHSGNKIGRIARNVWRIIRKLRTVYLQPRDIFKKYFGDINVSSFTQRRQNFILYYFKVSSSVDDSLDDSESYSSTNFAEDTISSSEVAEKGLSDNENVNCETSSEKLAPEHNTEPLTKRKLSGEFVHKLKRIKYKSETLGNEENATTDSCIPIKYYEEKKNLNSNSDEENVLSPSKHKTQNSVSICSPLRNLLKNDSDENVNKERNSTVKEYEPRVDEYNPEERYSQLIPDKVWKKMASEHRKLDQLIGRIKSSRELNERQASNLSSGSDSSWVTDEDEQSSFDESPSKAKSSATKSNDAISKSELTVNCLSDNKNAKFEASENLPPGYSPEYLKKKTLRDEFLQKLKRMKNKAGENVTSLNSELKTQNSSSVIPYLKNILKNDFDDNKSLNEVNSNIMDLVLPKLDESDPESLEICLRLIPDIEVWKTIAEESGKLDQLIKKIKCSKELKELSEKHASNWTSDSESSSDTDEDKQMSSGEENGNSSEKKNDFISNMTDLVLSKLNESNPEDLARCLRLVPDIEVWKKLAKESGKLDQLIKNIKCSKELKELSEKHASNWTSDSESSSDTDEDKQMSSGEENGNSSENENNDLISNTTDLVLPKLNESNLEHLERCLRLVPDIEVWKKLAKEASTLDQLIDRIKCSRELKGLSKKHSSNWSCGSESSSDTDKDEQMSYVEKNSDSHESNKDISNMTFLVLPKLNECNPEDLERCLRLIPDIEVWKKLAEEASTLDQLIEGIKYSRELKKLSEKHASNRSSDSENSSNTDEDKQTHCREENNPESENCETLEGSLSVVMNSSAVKVTNCNITSQASKMDEQYRKACLRKMEEYEILSQEQGNNVYKYSFEMDENSSGVPAGNLSLNNEKDDANNKEVINDSQSLSKSNELPLEYQDLPPLITFFPREVKANEHFLLVNYEKPHLPSLDSPASKEKCPSLKKADNQNLKAKSASDEIVLETNSTGFSNSNHTSSNSNSSQNNVISLPLPSFTNPDFNQNIPVPNTRHADYMQSQNQPQIKSTARSESIRIDAENHSLPSLKHTSTIGIADFEIGESSKHDGLQKSPEPRSKDPDYKPYPGMVPDATKVKKDARYQKKFYQKPT